MPTGTLKITTTTGDGAIPVANVSYVIKDGNDGDGNGRVLFNGLTNADGESGVYTFEVPPMELSLYPNPPQRPYSMICDIWTAKPGFAVINVLGVEIFEGQQTIQPINMIPVADGQEEEHTYVNPPPSVALPTPPQIKQGTNIPLGEISPAMAAQDPPITPLVLPAVTIPQYITVHLGTPGNTAATNVRVRFIDYVKNVTSHEIYPTWPYDSIVANIHCIVTFAVNRVYTEWYRARGFPYDITNSTTVDQNFVYGGQIFQNISQIVDGIFNIYARRQGFRNPYFTEFCNGTTATCKGLSQWGTVTLANRGLAPLQILHNYYPNDLLLVAGPSGDVPESYPGTPLTLGSSSDAVRRMQLRLNRISANFPLITQITNPNGYFGTDTQNAVRVFQRTFNLVQDGIVGRSTWNKISQVFTAVTKLAELGGEGERIGLSPNPPTVVIRQGSRGTDVIHAQFLLDYIAQFYPEVPAPLMDSIFGASTTEAVRAFQRRFGLTVDGVIGSNTWRKLYDVFKTVQGQVPPTSPETPTPPAPERPPFPGYLLRVGSRGESVRTLQALLNNSRILYSAVPIVAVDGVFGPATENAVRIFQLYSGLTVDGIVGPMTWDRLTAI